MGVLKTGRHPYGQLFSGVWPVALLQGRRLRLPVPNPSRSKDCAPVLVGITSAIYVIHGAIPVGWTNDMTHQNNAHVHSTLVTGAV